MSHCCQTDACVFRWEGKQRTCGNVENLCIIRTTQSDMYVHMLRLTETARMQVSHHEREGEAFVCRILTIDETGCRPCEPESKRQSIECRHQGSPIPRKCRR